MALNYHLDNVFFDSPLVYEDISVLQIGRLFCKNNTVIVSHIQPNLLELTIVTEGKGIILTNSVPSKVKKGDIYLSLPGDVHEIISDSDEPLKFDFFSFNVLSGLLKNECEKLCEKAHSPSARVFHDERILPLISNAIFELNESKSYQALLMPSIFRQIIIYTLRAFEDCENEMPKNATPNDILCYKLMNYIDTHIYTMKSLDELSDITDYSYGYLSSLFKKVTGNTLSEYYRTKKMDAAKLLLDENKLTATEIASLLNYSSLYAFSKAFTNHFGISPKNFKQNLK